MRQIFLLILLFIVGQWFVKALKRGQRDARPGAGAGQHRAPRSGANGGAAGGARAATQALPEPMVRCAECGVHAPRSESLTTATGPSFCCDQHARQYAARAAGRDRAA